LEARDRERELVETTLLGQVKQMERQHKEAEAILCAEIDKFSNEDKEKEKIEEALHG
jgi:hypothetical protein